MNNTKKKASTGTVLGVVLFAVVDVLLLVFLSTVLITGNLSSGSGSKNLSEDFVANDVVYFKNEGEELFLEEDSITIVKDGATASTEARPAPSTTPSGVNSAGADANGFLFPNSDTQAITDEEMTAKLTDNDACRHAINEIYARHGYQFSNAEILAYFNQFDWYKSLAKETDMNKVDDKFSAVEKDNVEKIQQYKAAHGW